MGTQISENEIRDIVAKVLSNMQGGAPAKKWSASEYDGRKLIGVFKDMNEAIEAANAGYKKVRAMSVEEREKIITEIRKLARAEAAIMAEMGVAETGMGKVEHKRLKHILVADKTPGTEDIQATAKTGDHGLTLIEMAPFGVVGAITPSTNPRKRCCFQPSPQCDLYLQLCG